MYVGRQTSCFNKYGLLLGLGHCILDMANFLSCLVPWDSDFPSEQVPVRLGGEKICGEGEVVLTRAGPPHTHVGTGMPSRVQTGLPRVAVHTGNVSAGVVPCTLRLACLVVL